MDRLICGDVGFGKTEVALRTIFCVVSTGKQAMVLAPTIVLAKQHFDVISERFSRYPNIRFGLLSRFQVLKCTLIQALIDLLRHCLHAVQKGRDPTPSELHLYVHTHGHDGKSFLDDKARIVHERYQEILQEQTQTQSDIDQWKAYYEAAGGEKRRRVYGLGSQAKCYYGPNHHGSSGSEASSSIPPSSSQSTSNLDELVMRLIPALTEHIVPVLTDHMIPVLTERVREMISSPSLTSTDHP